MQNIAEGTVTNACRNYAPILIYLDELLHEKGMSQLPLIEILNYAIPNMNIVVRERQWSSFKLCRRPLYHVENIAYDKWIHMRDHVDEFDWGRCRINITFPAAHKGRAYYRLRDLFTKNAFARELIGGPSLVVIDSLRIVSGGSETTNLCVEINAISIPDIVNKPLSCRIFKSMNTDIHLTDSAPNPRDSQDIKVEMSIWIGNPRDKFYRQWDSIMLYHTIIIGEPPDKPLLIYDFWGCHIATPKNLKYQAEMATKQYY